MTPERLNSLLRLEGGKVFWVLPPKYHPYLIGVEAGSAQPHHHGKFYWVIQIDGRKFKRSRVVYCLVHGVLPAGQIDHKDGDSLNDSPDNLRLATPTQNAWNHHKRAKRLDLPMGVRMTAAGRFAARLAVNKKMIHLGAFDTPEEARAVYVAARQEHYGEFA